VQVKIWFQNRRMKWRNTKERELLAAGTGCREQTLPTKNNPNPDLSDVTTTSTAASNSGALPSSSTVTATTPIAGSGAATSTTPASAGGQQEKKNTNGMKNHHQHPHHQQQHHSIQQKQIPQKKINVAVDQMLLNRGSGSGGAGGPLVVRQQQVL
jgi:hypothetical protein